MSACYELRIKDVDFDQGLVLVRSGRKRPLVGPRRGVDAGRAGSQVPERGPRVGVVPGVSQRDPRRPTHAGVVRRHHLSDSVIQKAVKAAAVKANVHKPVSCHTLRHCLATHLLLNDVDIRQTQE